MIAQRGFTIADQRAFAALSGDWNPLHVDPVAARRTLFGEPVVHGIHLVVWGLDCMIGDRPRGLRRLTASFRRPVLLDREIVLEESEHGVVAMLDGKVVLELDVEWMDIETRDAASAAWPDVKRPRLLTRDEVGVQSGEVPAAVDRVRAAALFPALSRAFPSLQLAEILATTRIVGMMCPGLHSLYSGLRLEHVAGPAVLRYRVTRYVPRYSALTLAVEGPTLAGTIDAFYRPPPVTIDVAEVRRRVDPGEFANRRALIIGGTRGLGEALVKAIAVGGGQLCFTYRSGAEDAARILRELGTGNVIELDVTEPSTLAARWQSIWKPSHVYYCATPQIRIERTSVFSPQDHARYLAYYVTGLSATLDQCQQLIGQPFVAWSPSTVFLDSHEPGAAAYCLAKAAMEELRHHLPASVTLSTPRLPRIATDQTAALIAGSAANPLDVALEQLRSGA